VVIAKKKKFALKNAITFNTSVGGHHNQFHPVRVAPAIH